ncbi:MAG: cytochrome P450 [Actinobacteria bacterium]|nr:cytochrome P450 [Actinomycetota bacterium]
MDVEAAVAFNPFEPGYHDDPYAQYARLREHAPVHRSILGPWFLFRHEDVERVVRDPDLSVEFDNAGPLPRAELFEAVLGDEITESARQRGSRAILNIDPPDHTRLRRLVSKVFTPKAVEEMRPRAQAIVDAHLDAVGAAGQADLISDLAFPLPVQVISEMLGMPEGDRDQLREWSHILAGTLDPVLPPEQIRAAFEASGHMGEYVTAVVERKRQEPADDLLTALVHAEDDGDVLSDQEVLDNVILLYIAGHETTVNLIGNTVLALLEHPEQWAKLCADPGQAPGAVEEGLRFDSPVQFTRRINLAQIEIDGHEIEPGSFVLACLGASNRDPAFWGDDADAFDITRPIARQHLSFGGGIHHCLGAALARVEAQVAIGTLATRCPGLRLAAEPTRNQRIVLRGLDALPVRF